MQTQPILNSPGISLSFPLLVRLSPLSTPRSCRIALCARALCARHGWEFEWMSEDGSISYPNKWGFCLGISMFGGWAQPEFDGFDVMFFPSQPEDGRAPVVSKSQKDEQPPVSHVSAQDGERRRRGAERQSMAGRPSPLGSREATWDRCCVGTQLFVFPRALVLFFLSFFQVLRESYEPRQRLQGKCGNI